MTRARALKQIIRARAARTGERYTTARRHVLANAGRPEAPPAPKTALAAASRPPVKGSVSDAKALEKTGHGLDHWFAVLDRFGAVDKGHSAAARHLFNDHGVNGWYSQGITVAYERARGVRAVNQRCDGHYEVSVSKVIAAPSTAIVKAFTEARRRATWLGSADPALTQALVKAHSARTGKRWVIRPDGLARFRYKWGDTTVQFYAAPNAKGKVTLTVQHTRLKDAAAVETSRAQWRALLAALAAALRA
jgi:hypothetical protein